MQQTVEAATGRKLALKGDLKLAFGSTLGLTAQQVTLSNPQGFAAGEFASAAVLKITLKLRPLLAGQLVVEHVQFSDWSLHLHKNKRGQPNWNTWTTQQQTIAAPATAKSTKLKWAAGFVVETLQLEQGKIIWEDATVPRQFTVTDINLLAHPVTIAKPISVSMNFKLQQPADLDVKAKASLTADSQQLSIKDLAMQTAWQMPKAKQRLTADWQLKTALLDLTQQRLELTQLQFSSPPLQATLSLSAQNTSGSPVWEAQLQVPDFNLRTAQKQGWPLPLPANPGTLTHIAVTAKLLGEQDKLKLQNLKFKLDDSHLEGQAELRNFSQPAVSFQLNLDRLDLDRYWPPQPNAAPMSLIELMKTIETAVGLLNQLKQLNLNGSLQVQKLDAASFKTQGLQLQVQSAEGKTSVSPAAKLPTTPVH